MNTTIVTTTRDFAKWAIADDNLINIDMARKETVAAHTKEDIRKLRNIGMPASTLALMRSMMKNYSETGYATFSKIRFLCWYWDNKDKIIFPMNSRNQVYLGNDSGDWCDYWPFFGKIDRNKYICNLNKEIEPHRFSNNQTLLAIGGQSHFGHFVSNRIAALRQSRNKHNYISSINNLLVPPDYIELHRDIIRNVLDGGDKIFNEFPRENKIMCFENVVIPCIDEDSDAITGLQGILEEGGKSRDISKGKKVYITRGENGKNDRIYNFAIFERSLIDSGFTIINPIDYKSQERLEIIGDSNYILTDSGSCALNGLLYGNKKSTIKCMIPERVLRSDDWEIINQLCMGFKQGTSGQWLPVQSYMESELNPWYDVCHPPAKDLFEKI